MIRATSKEVRTLTLPGILLALGVGIFPLYVFPSGGMQPSHLVLAAFAAVVLTRKGIANTSTARLIAIVSFYVFSIEAIYDIMDEARSDLLSPVYFVYNFLIFSSVYLHSREHGFSALMTGIVGATAIALVSVSLPGAVLGAGAGPGRATATFNNPNQLGYFSVCVLSISYMAYRSTSIGLVIFSALAFSSLYLSILSLSKAAMIATISAAFVIFFPRNSRPLLLLWLITAISALLAMIDLYAGGHLSELAFVQRLAAMSQESDSSMAARGYFAFLEGNELQLLFGLGAHRVNEIVGHEVHSTLGGMLNNYGIFGFLLISSLFISWIRQVLLSVGVVGTYCIVAPSFLYGLTHNGARFSIFWILVAVSLAFAESARRSLSTVMPR